MSKKAYIPPKRADQVTLYEQLKKARDARLIPDQVEHHVGAGPFQVEKTKTDTAPAGSAAPSSTSTESSRSPSSAPTGPSSYSDVRVESSATGSTSSGVFGVLTQGSSLSSSLPGLQSGAHGGADTIQQREPFDPFSLDSILDDGDEEDVLDEFLASDADTDAGPAPAPDTSSNAEFIRAVPSNSGIYHTVVPMKSLSFNIAKNESVIQHGGSFIVFGTDRPTDERSGYGGKGYQNANMIDMVVGRMASARGTEGPADGTYVDNNACADAARIYISQLTDIDVMFGLESGVSGVATGGSGIGIKADDVRIVGRRSIKIVTGNCQGTRGAGPKGEWTSLGFSMHQPAPTIELLAGNSKQSRRVWGGLKNPVETISTVQRACLGTNTRDAFVEINARLGEVWSAVFNLALIQAGFNSLVGVDPVRPWVAAAAPTVGIQSLQYVIDNLWQTKINAILWELNYLQPYGYKFICSTNIKLS